jgi:hypothetical protein
VVLALGRVEEGLGKFGCIIVEAREFLMGFQSWAVSHIRRGGNEAAHQLAKFVVSQQVNQVWVDSYPNCLSEIINAEQIVYDNI